MAEGVICSMLCNNVHNNQNIETMKLSVQVTKVYEENMIHPTLESKNRKVTLEDNYHLLKWPA